MEDYSDIRPYVDSEVVEGFETLIKDDEFIKVLRHFKPLLPPFVIRTMLKTKMHGISTVLDWQKHFIYPQVKRLMKRISQGYSLTLPMQFDMQANHTFLSNHRDIVLDSALLDVLLIDNGFRSTAQIAIGDNLLIKPWIKTLVRLNKAFIVQRSLPMREALKASMHMSEYMHHVMANTPDNIWIAQREGRAKDSSDKTQEAVLKMMTLGGEGTVVERLKAMRIVPTTISYEYDPCDYLKAKEFQLKRDQADYTKTKKDDMDNMRVGILGQKGRVRYICAPCINTWLDELAELPRTEFFAEVCRRIDNEIHRRYLLFPINYVCADMLQGDKQYGVYYSKEQQQQVEQYINSRIQLVDLPDRDDAFIRERILTMYANPVYNKAKTMA